MRNLKKFLALVLALMMVFSMMITVNAASSFDGYTDADKVNAKYVTAVETLTNINVFHGTSGTSSTFSPEQTITRAEMATIVYRVLTGDVNDKNIALYNNWDNGFTDVTDEWFAPYVNFAANAGIVVGDGMGHFYPNMKINGYQVLAILLRALGYDQPGEFTGKDWDLHTAEIAAQLHITDNLGYTLKNETPRQVVAQMTYNTAVVTERRAYTPAGGYSATGENLIELNTSDTDVDEWGAPSTIYKATFTWPQVDVKAENPVADKALIDVYEPVTQAAVYAAAGLNSSTASAFPTYTNGKDNTGTASISNTNVSLAIGTAIGAYGRWTRVYADRIVYVDTFLSEIDTVVDEVKVGSVTAIPASYGLTTYFNNATPAGGPPAVPTAKSVTATVNKATSFAEGAMLASNAVTDNAALGSVTSMELVDPVAVRTVSNVTVLNIIKDTSGNITGFTATNGTRYLYNYTYGYNGGSNTTPLTDTDLLTTVTLYVDAQGYVLGIKRNAQDPGTGVGVVVGADAEKISAGKYCGVITVMLEDKSQATVKFLKDDDQDGNTKDQVVYDNEGDAATAAEAYMGNLVKWEPDTTAAFAGKGYSIVTTNTGDSQVSTPAALNPGSDYNGSANPNYLDAGDATAVAGGSQKYLSDDTVFFVANYQMQNSKGGYVFTNYTIYEGFQAIPDLSFTTNSTVVDQPNAAASGAALQVEYFDLNSDNWIDYVLVLSAVNKSTNVVEPVANYAFLANPTAFVKVYDNYYQYTGIINGKSGQPLDVNYVATGSITNTGLYTYSEKTNDGWANVTLSGNTLAGNAYSYYAGVLYDNGSDTPASASNFYTVAKSASIYIVSPTTGSCTKVNVPLDVVHTAYSGSTNAIWWQYNKYGWIDTIYVEAEVTAKPGTSATALSEGITIKATPNLTSPSAGDYLSAYEFSAEATTNAADSSFGGTIDVQATWLKLNGSGQFVEYSGPAFEPGVYRVKYVLTVKNAAGQNYTIDSNTPVADGNAKVPTGAKGATVISDIITVAQPS